MNLYGDAVVIALLSGDLKRLCIVCAGLIGVIIAGCWGAGWIITSIKAGENRKVLENRADRAEDQRDAAWQAQQAANTQFVITTGQFTNIAQQLASVLAALAPSAAYATPSDEMVGGEIARHLVRIITAPGDATAEDFVFLQAHWCGEWYEALIRDDGLAPDEIIAFARNPRVPLEVSAAIFQTIPAHMLIPDDASSVVTATGTMLAIKA